MSAWRRDICNAHQSGCWRAGGRILLLLALALWPLAVQAEASGNIELFSRLSLGSPQAVATLGHYAYLAQGTTLLVIDIQDPDHPLHVGALDLNGCQVRQMAIDGQYAYLAVEPTANRTVLCIVDLRDPLRPVLRGSWKLPDNVFRWDSSTLAVGDNHLYVRDYYSNLKVFDVTDPDRPTHLYDLTQIRSPYQMVATGGRLYLANGQDGLLIFEATGPAGQLQKKYNVKLSNRGYSNVALANGLAYLSSIGEGLQIIDLANPAKPVLKSTDKTTTYTTSLALSGQTAWLVNYDGAHLLDVSDPAHPRPRGALAFKNPKPLAPFFVTDSTGCNLTADGLQLIQADDPDHPRLAGRFAALAEPHDIALNGSWAYVSDRNSFQAIDFSDPAAPRFAGNLPLPKQGGMITLLPEHRLAWVSSHGTTDTMQVIDLHDPARPALQSTFSLPGAYTINRTLIRSPYAYVLAQAPGGVQLHILDITDPAAPRPVSLFKNLSHMQDIAVDGDLAYLIGHDEMSSGSFIKIVDISDPSHPLARGSFTGQDPYHLYNYYHPNGLAFANNALFVLDFGLSSYAPAGPASLTPLGHSYIFDNGYDYSMSPGQNRLLLCNLSELRLYDISRPEAPQLLGDYHYNNSDHGSGIAMAGDLVARLDLIHTSISSIANCASIYRYRPAPSPVTILEPVGGELIPNDAPFNVHWKTDPASAGTAIRLELWSVPDRSRDVVSSRVADLGTYWSATGEAVSQVSLSLKYTGAFYLRAVSSWDPQLYGESLAPIYLSGSGFPFTAPATPIAWPAGSTQSIAWEVNPLYTDHSLLHFELWRGPAMVADLGTGAWQGDAGSLAIQLPPDLLPGGEYRIKCADFAAYGNVSTATPEITITNGDPAHNAVRPVDWALYD